MSKLDICLVVAVTLLSVGLLVTTSAKTIKVSDGKSLKEHLCSGSVAPNTNLTITVNVNINRTIINEGFCLIENTSNISITAEVSDYYSNITVSCHGCGFGFFNVSNLTIRSVRFDGCEAIVPPSAVRYINGTDQFLYYKNTKSALFFNHCINLTLYNVVVPVKSAVTSQDLNGFGFGVIGVNTCGHSKITTVARENHSYPHSTLLMYYTDSMLESFTTECNLIITSPSVYALPDYYFYYHDYYYDIYKYVNSRPHNMLISVVRPFSVYLTQQKFNVTVNTTLTPTCKPPHDNVYDVFLNTALILFVNSVTDSLVTFQGNPYDFCRNETRMPQCNGNVISTELDVLFYETPSFNPSFEGTTSPLLIKDTSFLMTRNEKLDYIFLYSVLQISKITQKISHEIVMENVSWCKNYIAWYDDSGTSFRYLFHAQAASNMKGNLILNMHNIFMLNNECYDGIPRRNDGSLIYFNNVGNVTMTGTNYFGHNGGGSVIILKSSNLTVSGNITINDGYSNYGGGIKMDTASIFFLKEPLSANFSNNNALDGSAIYAPFSSASANYFADNTSPIQISPIENYSVENITDINIKLYFSNNTFGSAGYSLYAPLFSYLGQPLSPNFAHGRSLWDNKHSQYVYTTLIDTIIQGMDMFDKHSSLSNGICFQPNRREWNCTYIDYSIHYIMQPLHVIYAYPGETALSVVSVAKSILYEVYPNYYVDSALNASNSTLSFTFYCDKKYEECKSNLIVTNTELSYSWHNIIRIIIKVCPFGFNLTGNFCGCPSVLERHNYTCDINSLLFTSPTGYWTGLDYNNTILFDRNCPPHYCNHSFKTFYLDSSITDLSCLNNHTGNLCGRCKENHSAVFGSDTCHSYCTDLYLLTLPVYAVAGLLLVTVLFALRLTVATGTVNGIIFYANTLSLVLDKLTEGSHGSLQTTQVVIISLLNLDLGFPLCLYKGMTTAAKVGFQFIFPIYLWSIVIGMIVVSKYSIKLSNFISNSSVQVLATLLYLSFAKLLRTVIDIASYSKMHSVTLTHHASSKIYYYGSNDEAAVWYYNGEAYGRGIHGLLLAVAVAFTALYLLPYVILTTFSHCLMRFRLFNKFRPFIDAYCGPFKDKWRFWFGLRLWLVVFLFSVDGGLQGTNTRSMLIIHYIVISLFILFQVRARPYKNRFVELLDTFLMINYWLIIASYFLLGTPAFSTAYNLLVSSAILILVLVFPYRFWCWLQQKFFTNIKFKVVRYFYQHEMILNNEEDDNEGDDDMYLFQAAEERDHIPDTY